MFERSCHRVHSKVLSSRQRILLLGLLSVTSSFLQLTTVQVKLRHALMISGLLLRHMFQELLVKMSDSRGNG